MSFNAEPAVEPIVIKRGDTWDMSYEIDDLDDPDFTLTGKRLDLKVVDDNGATVKLLSSEGTDPALTISNKSYHVKTTGFVISIPCKYDLQVTDGTDVVTIQEGPVYITQDVT